MKQTVKEDLENSLIEPTDDVIMARIVKSVEAAFMETFKSFQGSTARQVLYRCIKRVNQRDQETQMGVDMFAEERLKLNNTISALRTEYSKTLVNLEHSQKENEDLKKVKEKQSQRIRQTAAEIEQALQKIKDLESEAIQRIEELKNAQSIAWGKQNYIREIEDEILNMKEKLKNFKDKYDMVIESLEAKRVKKRKYKKELGKL